MKPIRLVLHCPEGKGASKMAAEEGKASQGPIKKGLVTHNVGGFGLSSWGACPVCPHSLPSPCPRSLLHATLRNRQG